MKEIYAQATDVLLISALVLGVAYLLLRIGNVLRVWMTGEDLDAPVQSPMFYTFRMSTNVPEAMFDSLMTLFILLLFSVTWPVSVPALIIWVLAYKIRQKNIAMANTADVLRDLPDTDNDGECTT